MPDLLDVAAIMEAVRPALEVAANAPRIAAEARAAAATAPMMAAEAKAVLDRLAFDFGQDQGRDVRPSRRIAKRNSGSASVSSGTGSVSARRSGIPRDKAPRTTIGGTGR